MVQMIGAIFPFAMISPFKKPQQRPIRAPITKSKKVLCITSYFCSRPMLMPAKARVEVMEMSIPAVSMTQSMPRAINIVNVLFRKICPRFVGERKEGLKIEMITSITIRTITRLASREPVIFFKIDFCSIYAPSLPLCSMASSRIFSWVTSSLSRQPVTRPWHITYILSLIPRISGISEDISMIP